jgi:hypothetical protein
MRSMRRLAVSAAASLGFIAGVAPASAVTLGPVAPLAKTAPNAVVEADWYCGPGYYLDRWGNCRPYYYDYGWYGFPYYRYRHYHYGHGHYRYRNYGYNNFEFHGHGHGHHHGGKNFNNFRGMNFYGRSFGGHGGHGHGHGGHGGRPRRSWRSRRSWRTSTLIAARS